MSSVVYEFGFTAGILTELSTLAEASGVVTAGFATVEGDGLFANGETEVTVGVLGFTTVDGVATDGAGLSGDSTAGVVGFAAVCTGVVGDAVAGFGEGTTAVAGFDSIGLASTLTSGDEGVGAGVVDGGVDKGDGFCSTGFTVVVAGSAVATTGLFAGATVAGTGFCSTGFTSLFATVVAGEFCTEAVAGTVGLAETTGVVAGTTGATVFCSAGFTPGSTDGFAAGGTVDRAGAETSGFDSTGFSSVFGADGLTVGLIATAGIATGFCSAGLTFVFGVAATVVGAVVAGLAGDAGVAVIDTAGDFVVAGTDGVSVLLGVDGVTVATGFGAAGTTDGVTGATLAGVVARLD